MSLGRPTIQNMTTHTSRWAALAAAVAVSALFTGCAADSSSTASDADPAESAVSEATVANEADAAETPEDEAQGAEAPEPAVEPVDLTGEWTQVDGNSSETYQTASVTGDTITVYWVNEADDTTALYWVGTYDVPEDGSESFTWTSEGDVAQMETALLASSSETKDFAYEGGTISYEVTAMGMTTTVELERE